MWAGEMQWQLLKVLNSWKDQADDKRHKVLTTEVHSQILVVKKIIIIYKLKYVGVNTVQSGSQAGLKTIFFSKQIRVNDMM